MKKLSIAFLMVCALNASSWGQKSTIIYLVRHAEKVITDPMNKDPELTEKGQKRALDLLQKLKKQKLSAIYSTDYQRTKLTAKPIADKKNLSIKIYDPKLLKTLIEELLQKHKEKKVLIVGHSNTVLETIEALGGKRPIDKISDDEYDYFFIVSISGNGDIEVLAEKYGQRSSDSVVSEKIMQN